MENTTNVIILTLVPLLLTIIGYIIWCKYGKNKYSKKEEEIYIPTEINSLELGFLYKGYATSKDGVSLLIYLANKGYIKISTPKVGLFTSNAFKITKLKEYDGNNEREKEFFEGLFLHKKVNFNQAVSIVTGHMPELEEITEVTDADIKFKFYKVLSNTVSRTNKPEKIFTLIDKKSTKMSMILSAFIGIIVILLNVLIGYGEGLNPNLLILGTVFPLLALCITSLVVGKGMFSNKLVVLIAGSIFGIVSWAASMYPVLTGNYKYIFILAAICICILLILSYIMPTRTKEGTEIFNKIKNFKEFIKNCDSEKINLLLVENPNYFFDMLPYTYVLDLSNEWIEKFSDIQLEKPIWFDDSIPFNMVSLNSFMNKTMKSVEKEMTSIPNIRNKQ